MAKWNKLQELLSTYEKGSSQLLNKKKTSIFCSSNTKDKDKNLVIQAVRGVIYENFERNLRLEAMVKRSKYNIFRWIKERV